MTETPAERVRELTRTLGPKAEEAYVTGAQTLIQQGRREGKAEGKAEAILGVLAARKLFVTDVERSRSLACTNVAQLDRWLERAVTAASASDVLAD